jgi:hypothetical protein
MLFRMLRRHRLKVAFVPSLMMINRESCDLDGFFRWVRRQLLTARLYHPGWPAVVAHGVSTLLWPLTALVVGLVALVLGDWPAAAWSLGGLALYEAVLPLLALPMEAAVRRIARARGEPVGWLGGGTWLRLLPAVVLTQFVYAAALLSSLLLRRVDWRGVHYTIDGPFRIRLHQYRPFQPQPGPDAQSSL